jgi:hypothetical protein
MDETDKPPSPIRNTITDRILHRSHNGRSPRRREMAFIQHLSLPQLSSRLRNDLVVLDTL